MEFKELMQKRRSVRKFNSQKVDPKIIKQIVDITLSAPSARNTRSSELVVITNEQIISQIAAIRDYGSAFLAQAPVAIIVLADISAIDLWEVNAAISATTLHLACVDAGLSSCWIHIHNRPAIQAEPDGEMADEKLAQIISIPEGKVALCAMAIGYSDFEPKPLPEFDRESKVRYIE